MPHIRAKDPACEQWNRMLMDEFARKGFYHSIPLPDGRVLEGIIPLDALYDRLNVFPIPKDLTARRVLDIGAWDGFFAFEMERRGATVTAIDSTEVDNFYMARELQGSQVDYRVQDVYDLTPERNGYFDLILFMGVLYHLKHPLLALERVCECCRDMAIVESFVTNEAPGAEIPALEFYETGELLGQIDNWCGPSAQCLLAFCRTAGFARAEIVRIQQQRAIVACYRRWLPEPEAPTAPPPNLIATVHATNYGINASARKDDYLSAFFKSQEQHLTIDNVLPEVAGYGIRPVTVINNGEDGWQANFKLPPGLAPGWQPVRLRTANSRYSNQTKIAVEMPALAQHIAITGACDGRTWRPGEIALNEDPFVSLWVAGLPSNADRGNTRVTLAGRKLTITDMTADAGDGEPRQINAKLSPSFPKGRYDLAVRLGDTASEPVSFRVV
jgi:tRNA (mo5U34)-methyltransferase